MISQALYEAIKFWLPLATVGGCLIKAFLAGRRGVSAWANQLLDNHLAHIQAATEEGAAASKESAAATKELLHEMKEMRGDFQRSYDQNAHVQTAILTGLEVLKDRD